MTTRIKDHLQFSPSGKLERLSLASYPNLLHTWDQDVDLNGKRFCPAGWDECFPTIDPYKASPVMGELIGWPPEINWQPDAVEQVWRHERYEAKRRFELQTPTCLHMSFIVTNLQDTPLEFLWASHALFDVQALTAVELSNGETMTHFEMDGRVSKRFIANTSPIVLTYADFCARLSSDQAWWGIWLNQGGWPANDRHKLRCLGLEATNTPGEIPDGQSLNPGQTFVGSIKIEVYSRSAS
ncbi:hypothetical protein G4Y79_07290 [Phototrophicus methaneseepsis]|uniref:Uncharacterized protein n=1 Tax=Phototrophicus methaneseepsis TaxID=2710758 RepID=A0A7S8EBZ1_9CHLR|nr:hypothetical protein [Phototrophicus methaneseepsis]QPC84168.1 hypothetical protein G4Y79_07290 [Phototrophicus methaneseepsis]